MYSNVCIYVCVCAHCHMHKYANYEIETGPNLQRPKNPFAAAYPPHVEMSETDYLNLKPLPTQGTLARK